MRLFGVVGLIVGVLAATAAGQDAVEIKMVYPKAGERVKVTVEEKAETKFAVTAMGMEQAKNEVKSKSLVYVEEVIEAVAGARLPTKAKRTYEKAVTGADGKTTKLPLEGQTVLIEKKGDTYAFTIDGKAVEGESLQLLNGEFNKATREDPRDLMLPGRAVKPGETWKIDADTLTKTLGGNKDLALDKTKTTATGKLVKAYKQEGKQFGVIELKIDAPITDLGPKVPVKLSAGAMTMTLTGDGVIDGSSAQGRMTVAMKFKVAGAGNGITLDIEANVSQSRAVEPLPRK